MHITLDIPEYTPETGITFNWTDEFEIKVCIENNQVLIVANQQGLLSLANHLLNLAQESVPIGNHIHLDDLNSLDEGSSELVIGKIQ